MNCSEIMSGQSFSPDKVLWNDSEEVSWNDFEEASRSADYSPVSTPLPIGQSTPQSGNGNNCPEPLRKKRRLDFQLDSQSSCDVSQSSITFNDFDAPTLSTQVAAANSPGSSQQSNASQLLGSTCCESRCLATLNLMEVESCRTSFQSHSKIEQQQFLLDTISLTAPKGSKRLRYLTLAGKKLCKTAFIKVLNISEKRLRKTCSLYLMEGATISQRMLRHERLKSSKYSTASAWMERYFYRIGDKMPHLEQIHLPHFLSKKIVYELMVQDLIDEGICRHTIISSSHFYAIW